MLPPEATHVDSEAELAVEIGRGGPPHRRGRRARLRRRLPLRERRHGPRTSSTPTSSGRAAKGFDTFCPLGDRLVPVSELGDGSGLRVVQRLNGELLQDGNTADLVFGVRRLVAFVSAVFTLEPGDLILTGTPSGVGIFRTPPVAMAAGDLVEVEIDGIGVLATRSSRND